MRHAVWTCDFRFGGVMRNTLHYGDCLNVMAEMPDSCVDLIYLDPPFNSKTDYNIFFPNPENGETSRGASPHLAQIIAFHDTWTWDGQAMERVERMKSAVAHPAHKAITGLEVMLGQTGALAYLSYMAERFAEMKRLLKPTGSIYLHCDPTMSHYLKAVMDEIFGHENFKNEIIWSYKRWPSKSSHFQTMHDVILFYGNGKKNTFNVDYEPASESYLKRFKGKTQILDPNRKTRKIPVDEPTKGMPLRDVWDISILAGSSKERLGYPTQKPIAVLERIIRASSNEGDVILDPFCGCGTTIEAAHKLRRDWIGIDISPFAVDLIQKRRMKGIPIEVRGVPQDLSGARKLAQDKPFDFEKWAVCRIPGLAPNKKQVGDGGIDGRGLLLNEPDDHDSRLVLAQTKGGKFSRSQLRDFLGVIERDQAALGVYITLNPVTSGDAHAEAMSKGSITFGVSRYPRAQLWSIQDHFNGRQPNIPPLADPYTGKAMQPSLF